MLQPGESYLVVITRPRVQDVILVGVGMARLVLSPESVEEEEEEERREERYHDDGGVWPSPAAQVY